MFHVFKMKENNRVIGKKPTKTKLMETLTTINSTISKLKHLTREQHLFHLTKELSYHH